MCGFTFTKFGVVQCAVPEGYVSVCRRPGCREHLKGKACGGELPRRTSAASATLTRAPPADKTARAYGEA